MELVGAEETDPFDTHPALAERRRALHDAPDDLTSDDGRSALELLQDREDVGRWLARATDRHLAGERMRGGRLRLVPWSEIPREVFAPAIREAATRLSTALQPLYPKPKSARRMLRAVVRSIAQGAGPRVALHLEPRLARTGGATQTTIANIVLGKSLVLLFQGALLERGATIDPSLGEACLVFRLGDERLEPETLVAEAMKGAEGAGALASWAERLGEREQDVREAPIAAVADAG